MGHIGRQAVRGSHRQAVSQWVILAGRQSEGHTVRQAGRLGVKQTGKESVRGSHRQACSQGVTQAGRQETGDRQTVR